MPLITQSSYSLLLELLISSSIAELLFPIIFVLIGFSLFIRPLWVFEIPFLQMKIIGISYYKISPNMKEMKQKMQNEDDYDFQVVKAIAKLFGAIAMLMAIFSYWVIIRDFLGHI